MLEYRADIGSRPTYEELESLLEESRQQIVVLTEALEERTAEALQVCNTHLEIVHKEH